MAYETKMVLFANDQVMIIVLFLHLSWVLRKQSLQKWSFWATIVLTMKTRDRTNVCFLLNK